MWYIYRLIQVLNSSVDIYLYTIHQLYDSTHLMDDVINSTAHVTCIYNLENAVRKWLPQMLEVRQKFEHFFYTDSFQEKLEIMDYIWEFSNYTKAVNESTLHQLSCDWYKVSVYKYKI